MKTNPSRLWAAAVLFAVIISGYAANTANAQRIDPATGLPVSGTANASHVDPLTGLRVSNKDGNPFSAVDRESFSNFVYLSDSIYGWPVTELRELIANGRYDEALQRCRLFHSQLKDNRSLSILLSEWVGLGRKFPKAREALIEVRDHDVREFSGGRGSSDLFWEVKFINGDLNQDDATYALFKTVHERDKQLAGQCYPYVERWLVQKGEYELCLNYLGDPQARFESIHRTLEMTRKHQERQSKMQQDRKEKEKKVRQYAEEMEIKAQQFEQEMRTNAELFRQESWEKNLARYNLPTNVYTLPPVFTPPRLTPPPPPRPTPPPPPDTGLLATNNFVGQVCMLVEILVATGHKADAEKIRDQAVAVLDDPRLQSAVSDAEQKIGK